MQFYVEMIEIECCVQCVVVWIGECYVDGFVDEMWFVGCLVVVVVWLQDEQVFVGGDEQLIVYV